MSKNEEMYSSWQGDLDSQSEKVKIEQKVEEISLNQLKGFKNHPFKVETNTALFELMQSIEREGILVPLLARPSPDGNGCELISGHRRKAACEWAGVTEVPVIICDMDDNEATKFLLTIQLVKIRICISCIIRICMRKLPNRGRRRKWIRNSIRDTIVIKLVQMSTRHLN